VNCILKQELALRRLRRAQIFDDPEVLAAVGGLLARGVPALWVAETDPRHFYASAEPPHAGWRDQTEGDRTILHAIDIARVYNYCHVEIPHDYEKGMG
jgi:hypothetical protein